MSTMIEGSSLFVDGNRYWRSDRDLIRKISLISLFLSLSLSLSLSFETHFLLKTFVTYKHLSSSSRYTIYTLIVRYIDVIQGQDLAVLIPKIEHKSQIRSKVELLIGFPSIDLSYNRPLIINYISWCLQATKIISLSLAWDLWEKAFDID